MGIIANQMALELFFKLKQKIQEKHAAKDSLFRKAGREDLAAVARIYDKIHRLEEEGRRKIGWETGVYPTEETALRAIEKGELFVYGKEEVSAAAIINQEQVDVYRKCAWNYEASDEEVLVLHTLVVDPDREGQGIGKAFVAFYEILAKERGCRVLRLDTNAKNERARRLYSSLGYREAGILPCDFNGIQGISLVMLEKKV